MATPNGSSTSTPPSSGCEKLDGALQINEAGEKDTEKTASRSPSSPSHHSRRTLGAGVTTGIPILDAIVNVPIEILGEIEKGVEKGVGGLVSLTTGSSYHHYHHRSKSHSEVDAETDKDTGGSLSPPSEHSHHHHHHHHHLNLNPFSLLTGKHSHSANHGHSSGTGKMDECAGTDSPFGGGGGGGGGSSSGGIGILQMSPVDGKRPPRTSKSPGSRRRRSKSPRGAPGGSGGISNSSGKNRSGGRSMSPNKEVGRRSSGLNSNSIKQRVRKFSTSSSKKFSSSYRKISVHSLHRQSSGSSNLTMARNEDDLDVSVMPPESRRGISMPIDGKPRCMNAVAAGTDAAFDGVEVSSPASTGNAEKRESLMLEELGEVPIRRISSARSGGNLLTPSGGGEGRGAGVSGGGDPEQVGTSNLEAAYASDDSDEEFYDCQEEEQTDTLPNISMKELSGVEMVWRLTKMASKLIPDAVSKHESLMSHIVPPATSVVKKPEGGQNINVWEEPPSASFSVRGQTYLSDHKKVPSASAVYKCLGADLLITDVPHHNVGERPGGFVQRWRKQCGADMCPFVLIINFVLPWGSFIAYFSPRHGLPGEPYATGNNAVDRMLREFYSADGGKCHDGPMTSYRDHRLKLVPRCVEGPWLVKSSVGGTPAIIGTKIPQKYYSGEGYFEIETDITTSKAALYILGVVKNFTRSVSIDLGFVLQGEEEDELPEQLLGALRFHHLEVQGAMDFDSWEARPL